MNVSAAATHAAKFSAPVHRTPPPKKDADGDNDAASAAAAAPKAAESPASGKLDLKL